MNEPWTPPDPRPASLTTPRLVIRPYEIGDAASLFRAIDADRESYLPWLPWVRTDNKSEDECVEKIELFRRSAESWPCTEYSFGIFLREDGRLAGGAGFRPKAPALHVAEIGYWTHTDLRGRGICTEAVGHLVTWLFTRQAAGGWGLRRVDIMMAAANAASVSIPRKLGLRLELAAVEERYVEGLGYHDTLGYGILATEWDMAAHRARDDRRRGALETP